MTFILIISVVYFLLECIFSTSNITNIAAYTGAVLGVILWMMSLFLSNGNMRLLSYIVVILLLALNIIAIMKNIWNNNSDR